MLAIPIILTHPFGTYKQDILLTLVPYYAERGANEFSLFPRFWPWAPATEAAGLAKHPA